MSHTRERRRAKLSGGKECGEEAPRKSLPRLAVSPLDFAVSGSPRALVLQREPARRLIKSNKDLNLCEVIYISEYYHMPDF